MNIYALGAVLLAAALIIGAAAVFKRRHRPNLKTDRFQKRWKEILVLIKAENGDKLAVIEADKLLDEALKRLHMSGKTTGERMVSAQKLFSNNDIVWAAHKLRNKLVHEEAKIKRPELEEALRSFRQALKDLGAL